MSVAGTTPRTLVVQIPCHNEEGTLASVLADLPTSIPGINRIIALVIDDGSTDRTIAVAGEFGAEVLRLPVRGGLARGFLAGLDRAIELGADIIVNTDGDGQYRGADIPALIMPIQSGAADLVIGVRPVGEIASFSPLKKLLQRLGSSAARIASGTEVEDAPSGFRAFSRDAAMRMHVFNRYTYTIETIIQAGQKGMAIKTVKIGVNPPTRPSRLARGMAGYVLRQLNVLVRVFMTYRPFRFFGIPGAILGTIGGFFLLRFLYYYIVEGGRGHVQSVVIGALLAGAGLVLIVIGLLADLVGVNRQLLEDIEWRLRRMEGTRTLAGERARTPTEP